MRGRLGQDHGHVAADRREGRQRPEGFRGVPARQQQVEVQLGQQHGVAQIVLPGQRRQQLAEFAKLEFAEVNGGRFQEEGGAVRPPGVSQPAQAELLQEFFEQAFQIVDVELRFAVVAAPEQRVALAGQGDGDAALFAGAALDARSRRDASHVKTRPTSNRATS